MYSPAERAQILDTFVGMLRARAEVLGVILVGSAAAGFRDAFSDLDFCVVIDGAFEEAAARTRADVAQLGNIVVHQVDPTRRLQLFLLDNCLELDVGYDSPETLRARRPLWRVVYDRTGRLDEIMRTTVQPPASPKAEITRLAAHIDHNLWYNTLHAVIAMNRGDRSRCWFELGEIRAMAAELLARRQNLDAKRMRQADLLDDEARRKLDAMFSCPQNCAELAGQLTAMLDCIFGELAYWRETAGINCRDDREFLGRFIEENCCHVRIL